MTIYKATCHYDDIGLINRYFATEQEAINAVNESDAGGYVVRCMIPVLPKAELTLALLNAPSTLLKEGQRSYEWYPWGDEDEQEVDDGSSKASGSGQNALYVFAF